MFKIFDDEVKNISEVDAVCNGDVFELVPKTGCNEKCFQMQITTDTVNFCENALGFFTTYPGENVGHVMCKGLVEPSYNKILTPTRKEPVMSVTGRALCSYNRGDIVVEALQPKCPMKKKGYCMSTYRLQSEMSFCPYLYKFITLKDTLQSRDGDAELGVVCVHGSSWDCNEGLYGSRDPEDLLVC